MRKVEHRPDLVGRHKWLHQKLVDEVRGMEGERLAAPSPQPRVARRLPQVWISCHRDEESLQLLGVEEDPDATSRSGNRSPANVSVEG